MSPPRARPPGLVVTATVLAAVVVVANVSVLNVALPSLSRELVASQTEIHWMVDVYAVVLAAMLLPFGAIGDRFGRRRILLLGLAVIVASNLATLALDSPSAVIAARAVSGVGAALVFPATLSTITATLPAAKRDQGVAIWTASVAGGGIVGILASGALVEQFWWGSVFVAVAAAAAVVLVVCAVVVPDSIDSEPVGLDPFGAALSLVGVGALVFGIIEGPVEGWTSPLALTGLVVGGLALVAFVIWEWRTAQPLLDVRLFAQRSIRAGSLSIFVQFSAAFGFFFVSVFHLAYVLGYGPLDTGIGLLPVAIGLLPASLVAIPLTHRLGRGTMGVVGLAVLAAAFVIGTTVTIDSEYVAFALVLAVFGCGIGLSSPPATAAIVESLPASKQGVASALNDVLRELGAAIGIAVVGSAFNGAYRASIADLGSLPPEAVGAVLESPAAAAVLAPDLGDAGPTLLGGVAAAVSDGWARSLWVLAAMVGVGTLGYALWAPWRRVQVLAPPLGARAAATFASVAQGSPTATIEPTPPAHDRAEVDPMSLFPDDLAADRRHAGEVPRPTLFPSTAAVASAPSRPDFFADPAAEPAPPGAPGVATLPPPPPPPPPSPPSPTTGATPHSPAPVPGPAPATIEASTTQPPRHGGHARPSSPSAWDDPMDPAPATAPHPSGLGAVELAATCERGMVGLREDVADLAGLLRRMSDRSAVPEELRDWPATRLLAFTRDVTAALDEPISRAHGLAGLIADDVVDATDALRTVHAELGRLGLPTDFFSALDGGAAALADAVRDAAVDLDRLERRFAALAALASSARATATRVRGIADLVAEAVVETDRWRRHPSGAALEASPSPLVDPGPTAP